MKVRFLLLFTLIAHCVFGQKALLQSGPMLGYNEMREVLIWAQTNSPAEVKAAYWIDSIPEKVFFTNTVQTEKRTAYTARLIADQVQPGHSYQYSLYVNNQPLTFDYPTSFHSQPLWQYRNDPPAFSMALGSCMYVNESTYDYDRPGRPYGGEYQIFTSMHKLRPDAMLWLGDNTYLREADWYTRTGILHRYTDSRSLPELQPLLASTHHYAIWDDHDFGPNDADRSFHLKELTLEAFDLFWGNPTVGIPGIKGTTTFFKYHDVDFFLLDNRYHRTANDRQKGEKTVLGKPQIEWLIDALISSHAPFKMVVIGGQVLNTAKVYETYINLNEEERAFLLQRIEEEGIKGVVFLTGDRHHSELSQLTNSAGNVIYDLTVSPLTAGPNQNVTEQNDNRMAGTLVQQRNFGILEFSGPRLNRQMKITIYDVNGKTLWTKAIDAQ